MILQAASDENEVYDFVRNVSSRVQVAKGILETARLLERGKAKLVVLADDVQPASRLRVVRQLCNERRVRTVTVSSRNRLGHCAGLEVPASCVALTISME